GRPPPGWPGAVPLRGRRALVAGHPRGRHPGPRPRFRRAAALPGGGDAAALGPAAGPGGPPPGPLERRPLRRLADLAYGPGTRTRLADLARGPGTRTWHADPAR